MKIPTSFLILINYHIKNRKKRSSIGGYPGARITAMKGRDGRLGRASSVQKSQGPNEAGALPGKPAYIRWGWNPPQSLSGSFSSTVKPHNHSQVPEFFLLCKMG